MEEKLKKVKEILSKENQEHLLANFDALDENQKEVLLDQIMQIDFKQMRNLYENVGKNVDSGNVKIEAIPYVEKEKIEGQELFNKGSETVKNGKLAVVTMAGGQGTRLRTQRPKRYICFKCKT